MKKIEKDRISKVSSVFPKKKQLQRPYVLQSAEEVQWSHNIQEPDLRQDLS